MSFDVASVVVGKRDLACTSGRDRFEAWTLTFDAVEQWPAEGELDTDAELKLAAIPGETARAALRIEAAGTAASLRGQITVVESAAVMRKAQPRPWQHDFTMESNDTEWTVGAPLAETGASAVRAGHRARDRRS